MKERDLLKTAANSILVAMDLRTQDGIRACIDQLRSSFPGVTNLEAEELAREFETIHGVTMTEGAALQERGFEPWLDETRSKIDPYYWGRYRTLLANGGFSIQVLATLSSVTDRILGFLENPDKDGNWDRRGMVMGHVQSGKTANYTGLACKSADAGYKVIIIIAGIHNNLRNQTQRRIDEGLVGRDSASIREARLPGQNLIGVGLIDSQRHPNVFTTSLQDFNKAIADNVGIPLQNLTEPVVFVIKKNMNTLKNLIEWLRAHNTQRGMSTIREPMLLIDDEADNASINIGHQQDKISRINGQIRELLALFDRSCYVGYTATPFANIFIDPNSEDEMLGQDLFPRDFIVSLDPPDNYFGPAKVFNENPDRVLCPVDDHEDVLPNPHPIDHAVFGLPESLKTAVRTFVVARAIRLSRGQVGTHNSMLVNVSRFVNVQRQIRNELYEHIEGIRSSVRVNGASPPDQAMNDPEIGALYQAFENQYQDWCGLSWPDVQVHLHDSVSAVNVIEVNSRSSDSLDYAAYETNGLNVIAVGGLSLSRGLTLEGLVVSYFLRNSLMYDTLLQMGRWFGYRDGYDDLCRVWMPEEAQDWYAYIAESIEELRDELARMQSVSATPKDFGLRVRSHPTTLVVTARSKMGSGKTIKVLIGLANKFVETAILRREPLELEANFLATISLAENLRHRGFAPENGKPLNGGRLVQGAPVSAVDEFLMAFQNHEASVQTQTEPVRRYIEVRHTNELAKWDILFAGVTHKQATPKSLWDESLGFPLVCQRRAAGSRSDNRTLLISNRQRVSSRGIEKTGLTSEEIRRAEDEYDSGRTSSKKGRSNYPDWIYRRVRTRPLLIIHLLAIGEAWENLREKKPVVAWSISFPGTCREEERVEYVVNTTWYQEHYWDQEDEDEDEGDYS